MENNFKWPECVTTGQISQHANQLSLIADYLMIVGMDEMNGGKKELRPMYFFRIFDWVNREFNTHIPEELIKISDALLLKLESGSKASDFQISDFTKEAFKEDFEQEVVK
jgi:hypothetical protein